MLTLSEKRNAGLGGRRFAWYHHRIRAMREP